MLAVSVAFLECEHECTGIILQHCVKPKVWYDFFYRYFTAPFKMPFGKRKPLFQDVQCYRETAAANPKRRREETFSSSVWVPSRKNWNILFLVKEKSVLTKESRQYTPMTKKCGTSCNTIWRDLFMLDRFWNESFVLMLPIFSWIISLNNVVKQCSSRRTVSFSILSAIVLKIMYIRDVSGK